MACRLTALVLDCRDPRPLAESWCAVLDDVVLTEEDDGAIEIGPASGAGGPVPTICCRRAPTRVPAGCPCTWT